MANPALSVGSCVTFVFPGQGSQRAGMGRDFHERFEASRLAYEEASDALGLDVAALCFEDDDRLHLTEYSQAAIVTTEIAMLRGLDAGFGLVATRFGGHSLGEYSALVAAGVLPLATAVRIVRERGRLMQSAVAVGQGAMVAVVGDRLDRDAVSAAIGAARVDVANDNSDGQIVLSGPAGEVRAVAARVLSQSGCGATRTVELDVSAPFHSWMMKPIEAEFAGVLARAASDAAAWNAAKAVLVTSNVSGGFHDADERRLRSRLVAQLSATVRWRDNMEALTAVPSVLFEVGPSRPLRGFFRSAGIDVVSIVDLRSAERALRTRLAA